MPVSDIGLLEIDTICKEEVAWAFLDGGDRHLDLIIQSAGKVSALFRIADEAEANDHYAALLQSLRLFMRMIGEVREILSIDFAAVPFKDGSVDDRLNRLGDHYRAECFTDSQEEEDWIMLADLIEYELVRYLRNGA